MSGDLEEIADDAVEILMFLGLALMFLGAPFGVVELSVVGLVVLLGGVFVGDTVGDVIAEPADGEAAEAELADPLEELRARYARGELSEAEFERTVERLLETEDLSVPEGGWRSDHGPDDATVSDADAVREREFEQP